MNIASAEARSMDAPTPMARRKKQATWKKGGVFAGVQYSKVPLAPKRQRHGLTDQAAFARTVETAAGLAVDASKLKWDFGAAAEPKQNLALQQIQKMLPREHNALVEDAEDVKSNPDTA